MSAVAVREEEIAARETKRDLRQEGFSLGFRLTLPAQLLVLFIAVFPLLMQLYISLTDWTPLEGVGWWNAWKLWNRFANYSDLVTDVRFLGRAAPDGRRHAGVRSGRILAWTGPGDAVHG